MVQRTPAVGTHVPFGDQTRIKPGIPTAAESKTVNILNVFAVPMMLKAWAGTGVATLNLGPLRIPTEERPETDSVNRPLGPRNRGFPFTVRVTHGSGHTGQVWHEALLPQGEAR